MGYYYYIAVWAVGYAESINEDVYLPIPNVENANSLEEVLSVLEKEHPDLSFNYGLADEDLLHNARSTAILEKVFQVEKLLQEIDTAIRPMDKMAVRVGNKTPVKLGPYLRSFLRHLRPLPPTFRLGGSNGELTVLKLATGITSVKALAKVWLRNVTTKLEFLKGYDLQITHPTSKQNIPISPRNEKNVLSGMSIAINLKNLTQTLLHHHKKEFLVQVGYTVSRFPDFDLVVKRLPHRCLRLYHSFVSLYESSMDIYLVVDDLEYLFIWESLYDVLTDILKVLNFGAYDPNRINKDLREHPGVLDELLAYYPGSSNVADFDGRIAFMEEWEVV